MNEFKEKHKENEYIPFRINCVFSQNKIKIEDLEAKLQSSHEQIENLLKVEQEFIILKDKFKQEKERNNHLEHRLKNLEKENRGHHFNSFKQLSLTEHSNNKDSKSKLVRILSLIF